jgi:plasmid stabilization system protein ParE
MSAFLLTARARADSEGLVRRLGRQQPRAARRALDELFATMDWLAREGGAQGAGRAPDGVRLWPLRDVVLAYRPPDEAAGTPAVLLRVLRREPGGA